MTFKFTVARVAVSQKEITIQAETLEEAETLALAQAPDESFGPEKSADYEIDGVEILS